MLKTRLISALLMLTIFLMSFFILDSLAFTILSSGVSIIALYELGSLLKLDFNQKIVLWIVSLAAFVYFYFFNIDNINTILLISLIFWLFFAPFHLLNKFLVPSYMKVILGIILILPLWISVTWLFLDNKLFLLFIFISIFIADTGAYLFGKKYGKHKLMKNVSPGKTIEGALGAFFLNIIFALSLSFYIGVDSLLIISATILITALSIFGDLYESLLKRMSGLKDSGSIIPGHGGILDRIDSFCPTIPIFTLILNYSYVFGVVL
ncbi:phosphatidate cytidylyltransferase [Methylophilaceae bacterium]|nr:phosphatidate cytidylyltransferase [Methylophilaceae bacterium]